jgi:hypothetical protein
MESMQNMKGDTCLAGKVGLLRLGAGEREDYTHNRTR